MRHLHRQYSPFCHRVREPVTRVLRCADDTYRRSNWPSMSPNSSTRPTSLRSASESQVGIIRSILSVKYVSGTLPRPGASTHHLHSRLRFPPLPTAAPLFQPISLPPSPRSWQSLLLCSSSSPTLRPMSDYSPLTPSRAPTPAHSSRSTKATSTMPSGARSSLGARAPWTRS